ncbi:hypothetical protein AAH994_10330 [Weeksellaceae bacterium A-14]
MYYAELIQKFWSFNERAKAGSTAVAMYLYLLKLGNDAQRYDVAVSDVSLSKILGITKKTVKPTKEKLRNLGLIRYENKAGFPCNYQILLDYPLEVRGFENVSKPKIKNDIAVQKTETTKKSKPDDEPHKSIPEIAKQKEETPQNNTSKSSVKTVENPTFEEFMAFAKTLDGYENSLDSDIKEKYDLWAGNNWKNNLGRPITSWKSSLKSILPYLKSKPDEEISLESLPNIKRPLSK